MAARIELGETYHDPVTHYTGTATAFTTFLHQEPFVRVTRPAPTTSLPEHQWFPKKQLEPGAPPLRTTPGFTP